MLVRQLEIKEDSYRNRKINLRLCSKDFFPEDSFGGSTKDDQATRLISLSIDGVNKAIKTDISKNKTGNIRWFFRDRIWVHCKFIGCDISGVA